MEHQALGECPLPAISRVPSSAGGGVLCWTSSRTSRTIRSWRGLPAGWARDRQFASPRLRGRLFGRGRRRQVAHEFARVDRQIGLTPHADRQLANRPLVGQLDPVDRHGLGMSLGGCRRDDPDPDIAFDEAADGIKAAQLDPQLKAATELFGLFRQKPLQRARSVQTDEVGVERLENARRGGPPPWPSPARGGERGGGREARGWFRATTSTNRSTRNGKTSRPVTATVPATIPTSAVPSATAATISSLSLSSRSMLTCGWAARKALSGSGRNSVSALVFDIRRT